MFYFKHKIQFWSFHNDTVNTLWCYWFCRTAMRWWYLSCICFWFRLGFFSRLISVFNYQALKVGQEAKDLGVQSQLEPWSRIKRWAVAGSGAAASVCQRRSHPRIHAAMKRARFVTIRHFFLALAQLNTRAQWTSFKGLWNPLPPDGGWSAMLNLNPRLGAPLVGRGDGDSRRLSVPNVLREGWWSQLKTDLSAGCVGWRFVGLSSHYLKHIAWVLAQALMPLSFLLFLFPAFAVLDLPPPQPELSDHPKT